MSSSSERSLPWVVGLGMGLLASVWAVGPAVLHSELPGASTGEAVAHAWGLSVAAEGLWTHGPFVRSSPLVGAPGGWHSDLVDPINGLLFALWSGGLSVRWAWTLTLVGWLVAGALGATALARRVGLDRGAALVLVVDPDDAIEECDEDDNMVYWPEVVCP